MKKLLLVLLALTVVIMPLSGCAANPDEYSIISAWVDEEGEATVTSTADDAEAAGESASKTGSTKKTTTTTTTTSKVNVTDTDAIDLKGVTITMAVTAEEQYHTTSFSSMVSAFEKKYNCKIKRSTLQFDKYNEQVSQKMSSGTSYDICFMHGSMFPDAPISGIYEDLTATVSSLNSANLNASKSKSMFTWKNKLYGVVANDFAYPVIMYYNKLMFQDAGLDDPLTLYNSGKWTWDKIFEMGKDVTDADQGVYFLGAQFVQTNLHGEQSIYINSDGKVVNNLKSANVIKGLQLIQKIYAGNTAIGMSNPKDDYTVYFPNGKCYMLSEESSKFPTLAAAAKKSLAFGKSMDNLGIVPVPLPAENTKKAYPTGWYTAVCAGTGSDPAYAVLWADHQASYESPVKGKNEMSDTYKALCEKLLSGNTLSNRHGQYATAGTKTDSLYHTVVNQVVQGMDITQVVNNYNSQFNACIEATVGKENYISK